MVDCRILKNGINLLLKGFFFLRGKMFSDCSFCHRFEEKLFSYKFAVVAVVHISNLRFFFSFFFFST